jgi:hypothetical protein
MRFVARLRGLQGIVHGDSMYSALLGLRSIRVNSHKLVRP